MLDESQAAALDEQSGMLTSGKMKPTRTTAGVNGRVSAYGADAAGGFTTMETYGDSGGASRFFFKAESDSTCGHSKSDTNTTSSSLGTAEPAGSPSSAETVAIETLGSRFLYQAKAPKKERPVVNGVSHSTVKPLTLMRWLIRLVTPPGGTVLDPFAGSGTTVEAALLEGFDVIGIEKAEEHPEYMEMIQLRILRALGLDS